MSFILLGILNSAAGSAIKYWITSLTETSARPVLGRGIAIDSGGNSLVCGTHSTSTAPFMSVIKQDPAGAVLWQRRFGTTGQIGVEGVAVDSSDNVYILGFTEQQGAGSADFALAKYNSAGTLQWQRNLGGTSSDLGYGVAVDSSDNVYITGNESSTDGSSDIFLAKYNSAGTIQWQRGLGGASGSNNSFAIAIDSSNNAYLAGNTNLQGAGSTDGVIAKYNSSGTIQWQRIIGGAGTEQLNAIAVDSSSNVYVTGYSYDDPNLKVMLVKYNSAGTLQWQKVLGVNDYGWAVTTDSTGNVYVSGQTGSFGNENFLIAKYNSSGTIQWQRKFGNSNEAKSYAIAVDTENDLYIFGQAHGISGSQDDMLLVKLPSDGSLTGTYDLDGDTMTYATTSLTAGTSSFTAATSTLTGVTTSLTSATGTHSTATDNLNEIYVGIG